MIIYSFNGWISEQHFVLIELLSDVIVAVFIERGRCCCIDVLYHYCSVNVNVATMVTMITCFVCHNQEHISGEILSAICILVIYLKHCQDDICIAMIHLFSNQIFDVIRLYWGRVHFAWDEVKRTIIKLNSMCLNIIFRCWHYFTLFANLFV